MKLSRGLWNVVLLAIAASSARAEVWTVRMMDKQPYFEPAHLKVKVGDTVVWSNSGPELPHVVITDDLGIFSDDIQLGSSWSYTFKRSGVYSYLCFRHFFMRGTVEVLGADGSTQAPPEYPYHPAFREFLVPTRDAVPRMIIASTRGDAMWFTEGGGDFYGFEDIPAQNKLGKIDEHGHIVEYATPTPNSDGSKVGVDSLVMDSEGNVWFTERLTNRIGRLGPSGAIHEFDLPRRDGYALGIDIDPRGRLWFAERYGNRIGWMTPDGQVAEIELPEKDSEPRTVFVGKNDRVWYTARVSNEIGYYDLRQAKLVRLQIPTKLARPVGICDTSDGTVYFLEMVGNKVAKVLENQVIEYPIPTHFAAPFKCVTDSENNIWFTEVFGNAIGKFDTRTETFVEYRIPTADSRPGGIAIDRKGRVWFTEQKGNKIGILDPARAQALFKQDEARSARAAEPEPAPGLSRTPATARWMSHGDTPGARATPTLTPEPPLSDAPMDEFKLPTPGAGPGNDLVEADGWLWFPEIFGNKIGAFNLESHEFREFRMPTEISMPVGLARDSAGIFWATQFRGNRLARLDPVKSVVDEYPVPTDAALPSGVTVDEHEQVWITELAANRIARFDRTTGRFEEFDLPRPESGPLQIVADRRGALWITASEGQGNYLARFDLQSKAFSSFPIQTLNATPVGLLVIGDCVWVAEGGVGKLARFDMGTREWKEFPIPAEKSEPVKLAQDHLGRLWITDGGGLGSSGGNRLVVFDPASSRFTIIPMKTRDAKPMGIVAASDGNVWFTQQGANRISRIRLTGGSHGEL